MKIDYERIRSAFPGKAWAYAEQFDNVQIGRWDGEKLTFRETLQEDKVLELRVFDSCRELKFTLDKCRDTARYPEDGFIEELKNMRYFMYGERVDEQDGGYTKLREDRGGALWFPAKLVFPTEYIVLKLGIRRYIRYNPVPVLPSHATAYEDGLPPSGAGALEAVDYAYCGFFYADGEEVSL
jgi:CRISPR-associated protein (TIGR03984 family)